MAHRIEAKLTDVAALATAVQELEWYTGRGGYRLEGVSVADGVAVWLLEPAPQAEQKQRRLGRCGSVTAPSAG